jgi:hypothetical protein
VISQPSGEEPSGGIKTKRKLCDIITFPPHSSEPVEDNKLEKAMKEIDSFVKNVYSDVL